MGARRKGAIGSMTLRASPSTKRAASTLPRSVAAARSGRAGVSRRSSTAALIANGFSVGTSCVDPLHEPLQDAAPYLVLADQILAPVIEIGIVVDFDHRDLIGGLLHVDPIEPVADPPRRAKRDVEDFRRRVGQRDRGRAAFARAVRPMFDDLPMATRHPVLADEKRF